MIPIELSASVNGTKNQGVVSDTRLNPLAMNKLFPTLALLAAPFLFAFNPGAPVQKPKTSPAATANYNKDGLKIEVNYSRPYKKGREIFGGLVPYDQVWRTGANEAATFETNKDLMVGGKTLPAGKYTLWTIPHEKTWEVIFNKNMYPWGVNREGVANREAGADAVSITVPVEVLPELEEQFTIDVREDKVPMLVMSWDYMQVAVPLK